MMRPIRLGMVAGVTALRSRTLAGIVAASMIAVFAGATQTMATTIPHVLPPQTAPLFMAATPSDTAVPTKTINQSRAAASATPVANPSAAPAPATTTTESPPNTAELTVKVQKAAPSGPGDSLGSISIVASDAGAAFKLRLHGLVPGLHGFHVYEDAECGPIFLNGVRIPAGAAGGIWDPDRTNKHAGPKGDGDLGDLPVIEVGSDGTTSQTLLAPRIKNINPLRGHALVIRAGGDNYSDDPNPQGGGGLRIACGSIE